MLQGTLSTSITISFSSTPSLSPSTSFNNRLCISTSSLTSRTPAVVSSSSRSYLPSKRRLLSPSPSRAVLPAQTTETVEAGTAESGFVEVGYLSSAHGLQGEICIKPSTDFPELRFSKPGRRWIKQQVSGREAIQEVELIEGRGHPGQKRWILRFGGINTVDQAKKLIGSTLLVREEDRPELEEGEFYSRDLVGMRVLLKETGEPVGTVVSVYYTGGDDLLRVQLDSSAHPTNARERSMEAETSESEQLVWVPFVDAIVPIVDVNRQEMFITPPRGLLELNLRADMRSKKERRQIEWKERKKFQKRLIAAKKKLCELEQQHVFHGFRYGEKAKGRSLADQIVSVNSKLLQLALQNIEASKRWCVTDISDASSKIHNVLKASDNYLTAFSSDVKLGANSVFQAQGLHLVSLGKVAVVLALNGNKSFSDPTFLSESFIQKLVKVEDRSSVPLILISGAHEILDLKKLFSDNDYFAFNSKKVWFLEETELPIVRNSPEEGKRHKIMMKSPWEILQSPVGSGGIFSLFSSHNMPESLSEIGVEYVEILSADQRFLDGRLLLLGFVDSKKSDLGVQFVEEKKVTEEIYDMILSMSFLKKLTKQIAELEFYAVEKSYSHVEMVDKEWVDVTPSCNNSYEIHCSLYSCFNSCSLEKLCAIEITG